MIGQNSFAGVESFISDCRPGIAEDCIVRICLIRKQIAFYITDHTRSALFAMKSLKKCLSFFIKTLLYAPRI